MDLITQVLLYLVFVLSVALYSRSGGQPHNTSPSSPSETIGSKSTKSKGKKKKKDKKVTPLTPSSETQGEKLQILQDKAVQEGIINGAPVSAPEVEASGKMSKLPKAEVKAVSSSEGSRTSSSKSPDSGALVETSPWSTPASAAVFAASFPHGIETDDKKIEAQHLARQEHVETTERGSSQDAWQSVGKGAARAVRPSQNATTTSYSSIASSNPFALLPTSGSSSAQSAARSISISPNVMGSSSKSKPTTSTQKAASTEEQTKRQRQNAARAAAAKQAKVEQEQIRLAKLEAHRREAQRERMREEERQKFAKGIHSSGPNGSIGSNGGSSSIRGNRGGLDSKASVNTKGQLVWD